MCMENLQAVCFVNGEIFLRNLDGGTDPSILFPNPSQRAQDRHMRLTMRRGASGEIIGYTDFDFGGYRLATQTFDPIRLQLALGTSNGHVLFFDSFKLGGTHEEEDSKAVTSKVAHI